MATTKPRIVKDYEKLDPDIQEQIKLMYPYGFAKHLIQYKNAEGKFVWPGFGDNARVLAWMLERVEGKNPPVNEHLFGLSPSYGDINWSGLDFTASQFEGVMDINKADWQAELKLHDELFTKLAYRLPTELTAVKAELEERLGN